MNTLQINRGSFGFWLATSLGGFTEDSKNMSLCSYIGSVLRGGLFWALVGVAAVALVCCSYDWVVWVNECIHQSRLVDVRIVDEGVFGLQFVPVWRAAMIFNVLLVFSLTGGAAISAVMVILFIACQWVDFKLCMRHAVESGEPLNSVQQAYLAITRKACVRIEINA